MMHHDSPIKSIYATVFISPSHSSQIHKPTSKFTCFESYELFKKCSSQSMSTEGLNCTEAVGRYMKCALGENCRL